MTSPPDPKQRRGKSRNARLLFWASFIGLFAGLGLVLFALAAWLPRDA